MSSTDPLLGALTGSPAYFPLNADSPALDAGNNATCAAAPVNNTSQNGVTRPTDGDGNGAATCDTGSYEAPATCTGVPTKPNLVKPKNGKTVSKSQVLLDWDAASCANTYKVKVKDMTTGKVVEKATILNDSEYKTKKTLSGKTYKWWVQACNSFGCGTKSVKWEFTTR